MSVKIGIGFGGWPFPSADPDHLWEYTDLCENYGVDSLWLSDRIVSEALNMEPMIALSFIAARTENLKFGTNVLALPLRNPTVLAKEVATLDFLSGGRSLPAVGLGTGEAGEYEACGTIKRQRGGRTDEAIEVMKLLWSQDNVTYHGRYFTLNDVTVQAQAGTEGPAARLDWWPLRIRNQAHRETGRWLARLSGYPRRGRRWSLSNQDYGRRVRERHRRRSLRRALQLLYCRHLRRGPTHSRTLYAAPTNRY